ncbi:CHAT domain-containing protein [Maribacter algicola]|uniref:CHAT domain-containing protein n=1 Tax=Maribacter algicola TaxID=2498892 RepID=A0A3R8R074_9FLAO|nr:CHAT domain-containing protein [Maribacter algicola]RRQ47444.1 CHAT domain-containing protein [Maribacter algicola]
MNNRYLFYFLIFTWFAFSQTKSRLSNTQIADSLDLDGEHSESLIYRNLALKEKGHSEDFSKLLLARWHYTTSCILETEGGQENHKKALEHSLKAREICDWIGTDKNYYFRYLVNNRIYHQNGWLDQWNNALSEAKKGLNILLDTLPDHHIKVLYLLDDLGFLHTVTDDPERANTYYERSYKLYKKYHPEEMAETYVNAERMAENYKKLGLRHEEFRLLSENEAYWMDDHNKSDAFFYRYKTYRKLAEWYHFYGNFELAENYLKKEEQLFDTVSNSHKKNEKQRLDKRELSQLYFNYAKLYLNSHNEEKAKEFLDKAKQQVKGATRFYTWEVKREIDLYVLESKLSGQTYETASELLNKAIDLAKKYKSQHYTNPVPLQTELFQLFKTEGNTDQALALLDDILKEPEINDNLNFQLNCQKGTLLHANGDMSEAGIAFQRAIQFILKEGTDANFANLDIDDIKEFYNYHTLEGMLLLGDFLLASTRKNKPQKGLEEALNIFLLSSKIFDNIYIGDTYNDKLYEYYKTLESGLVSCLEIEPKSNNIDLCLQALENNASKLTWSKFMYGKYKHQLKIPENILKEELKIKTLLNYYQSVLYQNKRENQITADTLTIRILDLKKKLRDNQEFIEENYNNYYNRSVAEFNTTQFRQDLNEDQAILKYSFINNYLYAFLLTKEKSSLTNLGNEKGLKHALLEYISNLRTFNSNPKIPQELISISELITHHSKTDVTIIPTETLGFLPYETLIPNYIDTDINLNYSTSLSLYQEQKKTIGKKQEFSVGIFTGQGKDTSVDPNFLPSVDKEINTITSINEASIFYQATKETFIQKASDYKVLHLAMHSNIDNENPEFSNLQFNGKDLLIGELYNESIASDLAILSACDTGNGKVTNGEGVQSVSNAFTYAGVPSTLVSLWKVDDKATSTLMGYFYKFLNQGKSKSLALKLAKKAYLNSDIDQELKHPYYWSGFILSGNTDALIQNEFNYWWLALLVIPLISFLSFKRS